MLNLLKKRNVNGVLLIDKCKNYSSNSILQQIKKIFNAKKVGHTGSLDPIATGLLLVCFGECTKFSKYLMNLDKFYEVIIKLGENTSTFDIEGETTEQFSVNCTQVEIKRVLQNFSGAIDQTPPVYSAIKYKGKSLYKYARSGIKDIPLKKRKIVIYKIFYINYLNNFLKFRVLCSKGTYIRSLAYDIGKVLKCGAHVVFLRRLMIGNFSTICSLTLSTLRMLHMQFKRDNYERFKKLDNLLLSVDTPVLDFPSVNVTYIQSIMFRNGQKVLLSNIKCYKNMLVRVIEGTENRFIGIGLIDNNKFLISRRLVTV